MPEDYENVVNDTQEDVVGLPDDNDNSNDEFLDGDDDISENSPDVAEPEHKPQSKEENAIWAKARRKAEEEYKPKLSEYEQDIKDIEELTGMSRKEVIQYLKNQKVEAEAQQKADEMNVPVEIAREIIEQREEINQIKSRDKQRELQSKKGSLKDKPYFSELETEIEQLVANGNGNVDYETAYKFVLGDKAANGKLDEIRKEAEKKAQQRTIADVQDRQRRGIPTSGDASTDKFEGVLSDRAKEINDFLGINNTDVAKHVAKRKKEFR